MTLRNNYFQVSPNAVKALGSLGKYFDEAGIDHKFRALVELRVSQINGCAYCVDLHNQQARAAGETQQRLDCLSVWRDTGFYSEKERAALAWAESVTRITLGGPDDALFQEVSRHFSEKELADLTFIIATMNAWNRIAISFKQSPKARG